MQSGVLSPDNLADVLRGISQRRRQGTLDIQTKDGVLTIRFVQGRVVEAFTSRLTPVQETIEWLQNAGYPVKDPKEYEESSYQELAARLSGELAGPYAIGTELLAHVIKHRVLERLYTIDVGVGSLYTFKVQMVEQEAEFAPTISVGQLLLDLVELTSEADDFRQRFPDAATIRVLQSPNDVKDEDSVLVVRAIGAGAALAELERRSLLSSYHFRHALLQLSAAGAIEVVAPRAGSASLSHSEGDGIAGRASTASDGRGAETDSPGTLQQLADVDDDEFSGSYSRSAAVQMLSARLLQNSAVPKVLGVAFLLISVFSPFVLWRAVLSAFSE